MNAIIEQAVKKIMTRIKALNSYKPIMGLASMAEDAVKIMAEYQYDRLAKTKYFQKIVSLDMKLKLLIVATMLAINAWLKINMEENNAWNLFLKGILTDLPAEIGKRVINGDNSPDPEKQEVIELIRHPDGKGGTHYAPKEETGSPKENAFTRAKKDVENGLNFFAEELRRRRTMRKGETP